MVQSWRDSAKCIDADPEAFFALDRGHPPSAAKAATLCAGCPVTAECLEYALATDTRFGVYGGISEADRQPMHEQRNYGTVRSETLAQLIRTRLTELGESGGPLSFRAAAERSDGEISAPALNNLALGKGGGGAWRGGIRDRTLRAIAAALDVPYERVELAAARNPWAA